MTIMLSGGGTLGPVIPLLALYDDIYDIRNGKVSAVFVGTHRGPERAIIEAREDRMPFVSIAAGKWDRHTRRGRLEQLKRACKGFQDAWHVVREHRPDLLITMGGYVSFPLHLVAWLHRIPTWVHQQDAEPTMTNKLLAPFATVVTTGLASSCDDFPKNKTLHLGNPVRAKLHSITKTQARSYLHVDTDLPMLFVTGGGTGAVRINELLRDAAPHLSSNICIFHLTGPGRDRGNAALARELPNYHVHELFTDKMPYALAAADLVVTRGGYGTLVELAALKKPAIFFPLPGHQERNTAIVHEHDAGVVLDQEKTNAHGLIATIELLFAQEHTRSEIGDRLHECIPPLKKDILKRVLEGCLGEK